MKLLKRISLYFIMFSALVFVLGSISTYLVLETLIGEEVRETLESEKRMILEQIKTDVNHLNFLSSGNLEIKQIPDSLQIQEGFADTSLFVAEEHERVPFRQLVFTSRIDDKNYRITLRRSLIEKDDLVLGITVMMMTIFVTMILLLNGINYWSDRRLWKPFYLTLNKLDTFKLNRQETLNLPDENIEEFNQLNRTLNTMANKLQQDYFSLKEFSENAAHEMQTPLAVIRSKLDVLIQDQKLSAGQMQTIHSLYHAVNRLARLNQSLNLLTKIENREYHEKQSVDFCKLIEQQLQNLNELIQINKIKVISRIGIPFVMEINPFMAETLLSNLLINAVKHNKDQGFIELETTPKSIIITNSGHALKSGPQELFARFKKDNTSADSPGLGLSIVQSICSQNGLNVNYICKDGRHTIKIWK